MRLEPGERVVVRARAHPRALRGAAARLVLTALLLGVATGWLDRPDLPGRLQEWRAALRAIVLLLAGVAVLLGTLRPLLRWLTRSVLITTHRLVRRGGPGGGEAMPLTAIADVVRRRHGAGAGDLLVTFQDPLRRVQWRLRDVPEAERFEQLLADLTRRSRSRVWPPPAAAADPTVPTGEHR